MFREQNISEAGQVKYVSPGEIVISSQNRLLISSPLGSCVAVMAYDKTTKSGGMTHVMLPGKSAGKSTRDNNKYAGNAIDNLLGLLHKQGASSKNIEVCLAGGANVLKRPDDTIAKDVVDSVLNFIKEKKLTIRATALGGFERRTASLNTEKGIACYTVGDSSKKTLWKFNNEN